MPDFSGINVVLKRGAIASSQSAIAAATPHVALPGAPPQFIWKPRQLSVWGNVQTPTSQGYGDCVTAEEAFAKACHNPEFFIPDDEVIRWAGDHDALDGAQLIDVLKWMQASGFRQSDGIYCDGQYYRVNWEDGSVLHSAISQGPVKIGVASGQLEESWGSTMRNGWLATGYQADRHTDHCVSLCGYGSLSYLAGQLDVALPAGLNGADPGYAMFTWGTIGIIDLPSMLAITHEAWLRKPTTVVKQNGGTS